MHRRDLLRSGGFAGLAMLSGRAFAQSGAGRSLSGLEPSRGGILPHPPPAFVSSAHFAWHRYLANRKDSILRDRVMAGLITSVGGAGNLAAPSSHP
jgi:hypothetical protein